MKVSSWAKKHGLDKNLAAKHASEVLEKPISASTVLTAKQVETLDEYELPTSDAEEEEVEEDVEEEEADDPDEPVRDPLISRKERSRKLVEAGIVHPDVVPADGSKPKNLYRVSAVSLKRPAVEIEAVDESEAIRQYILMAGVQQEAHRHRFTATKV